MTGGGENKEPEMYLVTCSSGAGVGALNREEDCILTVSKTTVAAMAGRPMLYYFNAQGQNGVHKVTPGYCRGGV